MLMVLGEDDLDNLLRDLQNAQINKAQVELSSLETEFAEEDVRQQRRINRITELRAL
jgi:hypothetical protein